MVMVNFQVNGLQYQETVVHMISMQYLRETVMYNMQGAKLLVFMSIKDLILLIQIHQNPIQTQINNIKIIMKQR